MTNLRANLLRILLFCVISISVACAANLLIGYYKSPPIRPGAGIYDSKLEDPKSSWVGPRIGEVIDLQRLQNASGKLPVDQFGSGMFLFLVINPSCTACQASTDQMQDVEKFAHKNAITFYIASFRTDVSFGELLVFRDSALISSDVLRFNGSESDISSNSKGLQYPCYFLTDIDGKILRIFVGSYSEKAIRDKLTRQLEKDTLFEKALIAN